MLPNDTGKDTIITVGGDPVAYTNGTYDLVYDTADSNFNDSPSPYTAVVSRYLEGTIEWDGSQVDIYDAFINDDGSQVDGNDVNITFYDREKTIIAEHITITNLNRETPADDKTNGTLEFTADVWRYQEGDMPDQQSVTGDRFS